MTTYNTGNPIGSTDSRDRLDNTENMDYLENSTTELTHADRLGTVRKTRHGMEVEHDAQIAAHELEHDAQMQSFEDDFDGRLAGMAFTRVGSFTTGATLTDMRQVLVWEVSQGGDGHEYGWSGSFPKVVPAGSTPATSGGIGAGAWTDRTDATLRDDLNVVVKRFSHVSAMVSDTKLYLGQIVETISYYDGWAALLRPFGGATYEIVAAGTGTDDGGSFIDIPASGVQAKQIIRGAVDVTTFGAKASIDCGPCIQKACDYLKKNQMEWSRSLYFPEIGAFYKVATQINLTVAHGSMKWWSDSSISIDVQTDPSVHVLIVDFATGATANVLKFEMENIQWGDSSATPRTRKGPHFKRVFGSRFVNCHFNSLKVALALDTDFDYNHFDSCQWRANERCLVGYNSVANDNLFTNCIFRYNTGTILNCLGDDTYPGTFEANQFIGGGIEPNNTGEPIIKASTLRMKNVRFETNTHAKWQVDVHDCCRFEDIAFHGHGGAQPWAFNVLGSNNHLHICRFAGSNLINFGFGANNNTYGVDTVFSMNTLSLLIRDNGEGNTAVVHGIAQTKGLRTKDSYLIPHDLTQWQKFGCTVTYDATNGYYTITADGTQEKAYIYYEYTGDTTGAKGIGWGVSAMPMHPSGQLKASIYDTAVGMKNTSYYWVYPNTGFKRNYLFWENYNNNPVPARPGFLLELVGLASCRVRDVVMELTESLPSL